MSLERLICVMYPADPAEGEPTTTIRMVINTYSLLEIEQRGTISPQQLFRMRRALIKAGARPPDQLTLSDIKIDRVLPIRRPAL